MKIYTKTGDKGTTALFGGGRVPKTHPRVEAYGAVDELNAATGMVRAYGTDEQTDKWLERVQNQLFHLGADLATPLDAKSDRVVRIGPGMVVWLEQTIDEMEAELPALENFVLPGGSLAAAQLHVARTVCRRAERLVASLQEEEETGQYALPYLNRLSDWLFMLARRVNKRAGISESQWLIR